MTILILVMLISVGGVAGTQTDITMVASPQNAAVAVWSKRNHLSDISIEGCHVSGRLYEVRFDSLSVREVKIPPLEFGNEREKSNDR